ncbi:PspA/IM30 family protein [Paenibacillus pinistramenti]|uniref:PspA/IM30 family protein n=1 Tax=Paenibacillus pinistramenti TaxID=1768003 RepID=UPI00139686B9|nr:PspA/IM30 family protein [Paenibacillus pinistramenti]
MSLFDRIANITKATLHEALNKLEDPVVMTGQYLRNLEEELDDAKSELAAAKASARLLQAQREEAGRQTALHEQHALNAIKAGDELTARRAVEAKLHYSEQASRLAAEEDAVKRRIAELELQLEMGEEELERLKKKREELAERARKASELKASARPQFTRGLETGAAARGFERMEEKINGWEASAAARGSVGGHPASSSRVDEEIARLQGKMNASDSGGEAGSK